MTPPDEPSDDPAETPAGDDEVSASAEAPSDQSRSEPDADDGDHAAAEASGADEPAAGTKKKKIPAPPRIGPPPTIGKRSDTGLFSRQRPASPGVGSDDASGNGGADPGRSTTLAMGFDLGDNPGPAQLTKLTAGPARLAGAEPPAEPDAAASESSGPGPAEGSGRSGLPRLPVPGMLQGDGKPAAKEFRSARKRGNKGSLDAGVLPPGGVLPPSQAGAPSPVEPENTDVLIDDIAAELVELDLEPEPEPDGPPPPPATTNDEAPAAVAAASTVAGAGAPPDPRRWMFLGAALLGLVLLIVWMTGDDEEEASAEPRAKTAAGAAEPARAEPPAEPAEPEPEPEPLAMADDAADGSTTAAEAALAETSTGAEPEAADSTGAAEGGDAETTGELVIVDPEPTPEASDDPSPNPSGSGKPSPNKRAKKRAKKSSPPPSNPDPKPSTTPSSGGGEPTAAELLAQAQSAYKSGNGVKAYGLAAKSNRKKRTTDALEIMALASCLKKDKGRAKTLLKKLPLFSRPKVRSKCKSEGIPLGL